MYFILLCLHLLCAIFFVGYVFFDAIIYPLAYKKCDKEECEKIKKSYTKSSGMLFGIIFICLLATGGALLSYYDLHGFFTTHFGILLSLKLALIGFMLLITLGAVISIRFFHKDIFKGKSHLIALIISLLIVILAKAMKYF